MMWKISAVIFLTLVLLLFYVARFMLAIGASGTTVTTVFDVNAQIDGSVLSRFEEIAEQQWVEHCNAGLFQRCGETVYVTHQPVGEKDGRVLIASFPGFSVFRGYTIRSKHLVYEEAAFQHFEQSIHSIERLYNWKQ